MKTQKQTQATKTRKQNKEKIKKGALKHKYSACQFDNYTFPFIPAPSNSNKRKHEKDQGKSKEKKRKKKKKISKNKEKFRRTRHSPQVGTFPALTICMQIQREKFENHNSVSPPQIITFQI